MTQTVNLSQVTESLAEPAQAAGLKQPALKNTQS